MNRLERDVLFAVSAARQNVALTVRHRLGDTIQVAYPRVAGQVVPHVATIALTPKVVAFALRVQRAHLRPRRRVPQDGRPE